ncbi:hypothetical protein [Allokutzneria sp. A3M-2-11 16]|nr:hypothetical protein [Allokutzneria sp. A3M-2-11 16]
MKTFLPGWEWGSPRVRGVAMSLSTIVVALIAQLLRRVELAPSSE